MGKKINHIPETRKKPYQLQAATMLAMVHSYEDYHAAGIDSCFFIFTNSSRVEKTTDKTTNLHIPI